MASKFIPLDEAAKMLGISPDRLVEMRSNGEVRGFRDGKSWKFPEAEVDRLLAEQGVEEQGHGESGESSILVNEPTGDSPTGRSSGSTVIGADKQEAEGEGSGHGSDVGVGDEAAGGGSDVALVAHRSGASGGSDVKLVASEDSGELQLAAEGPQEETPQPAAGEKAASGEPPASAETPAPAGGEDEDELKLMNDDELMADLAPEGSRADAPGEHVLSDDDVLGAAAGGTGDLIHGDSDPALEGGSDVASRSDATPVAEDDDDLVIADEDGDDDLVLSGGSDVAVGADSGINLMSPSDSGLSLEGEPLDLAGSSISALDLGSEVEPDDKGGSKSGSGSLVDFQADEEFQLSPSGVGMETDEDSGSQVIEVDDSAEAFGDDVDLGGAAVVEDAGGFDEVGDEALVADDEFGGEEEGFGEPAGQMAMAGARPAYEVPFSIWNVVTLLSILLVMCVAGMMMSDLVRNMSAYAGETAPVNSLTDAILGMIGADQ